MVKIRWHVDAYKSISFKLGKLIDRIILYILILVLMTLTFTHGHRFTRKLDLVQ